MNTVRSAFLLAICSGFALSAHAALLYVAPTNAGVTTDGSSWANAYTTLQQAVDAAATDDTLCIRQGAYTNTAGSLVLDAKTLTLLGGYAGDGEPGSFSSNAALTILDGAALDRVCHVTNSTVTFERLTFRNGTVAGFGAGIQARVSHVTLRDCAVRDNILGGGETQGGGLYLNNCTSLLERCVIRDNVLAAAGGTRYGGGLSQSGGALTMNHCVVMGNTCRFYGALGLAGARSVLFNCLIRNNADGGYWGTIRSDSTRTIIENCTIADNASQQGLYRGNGNIYVTNSILWNNGDDVSGSSITLTHCCIEDPDTGTGVIHDDPLFAFGHYLADGSPCLNAGTGTAAAVGLDTLYAHTNQADSGVVDLGFHAPAAFAIVHPDLFVDPVSGNDGNTGATPGLPLRTIGHALAVAEPGARIRLAAGTYDLTSGETFPLTLTEGPVQLLGTNAALTILSATNANQRVLQATNLLRGSVISNLTIRDGRNTTGGRHGVGLFLDRCTLTLADTVIRDNTQAAGEGRANGVYLTGGAVTFNDCSLLDNRTTAGGTQYAGALEAANTRLWMTRCVVANNLTDYDGGILVGGYDEAFIRNCLIVSNQAASSGSQGYCDGLRLTCRTTLVENVTIANNGGIGLSRWNGTVILRNSIFRGNGIDVTGTVSMAYSCAGVTGPYTDLGGNTNVSPDFIDEMFFHLKSRSGSYTGGAFSGGEWVRSDATSPLIDAGDPAADFSLEPSHPKGALEMGAYGNTGTASLSLTVPGSLLLIR